MALEDSHGTVKDYFIIVHEPGRCPEKKRPPVPTSAGAERMLCELLHHRPTAELTLIQLTRDDDLWITDGFDELSTSALSYGLPLPDGSKAKLRLYDRRGWEIWVKRPGERRARKAAGGLGNSHDALRHVCGPIWAEAIERENRAERQAEADERPDDTADDSRRVA